MESRTIERDGVRLHGLWRPGKGVPVVVVPGAMADAEAFRPVVEAMDLPHPVLVLDRRGRAPSGDLGPGYGIDTEVADLLAWVAEFGQTRLAGWSYGGTIALEAAARTGADGSASGPVVGPVVAYEPVLPPFGMAALPSLREADPDRAVEIVNIDISRSPRERLEALRASPAWKTLRLLAIPLAAELTAINAFHPDPAKWSRVRAELILGEHNQDAEPYGSAFNRVVDLLPRSRTTLLAHQGHLAHAEDPVALGRLMAELLAPAGR
ncbi:hypothetical protein QR77_00825 [Streptomyces sp. 150FB]|uniref:alpha/beta fold hydrolase n=1 Tax=Streptomyces sp. 150FB TaxID=1576605 RepID=UPI0005894B69|nr:alpha/beta hydrolase [Streptomyces sp. 150FB]KIF72938.1 hypothetical protein QR77_00825 [Streptomyces sp. 150FB]